MKAKLEHDILTSTIQFKIYKPNISFIYSIPPRLNHIIELSGYDEGFITMQTNYGEEYTDLIETIEQSKFTKAFKKKAIEALTGLTLQDIELRRV
ncbi:MAG: hypothetical protein NC489_46585 [Ruminococcus flavefaciens]|nr:hypothetical protein [Ruminococcus flavefaciens]